MGHNRTRQGDTGAVAGGPYGQETPDATLSDRSWAPDVRAAVFCALALFGLVLLIDWANATLSLVRLCLWAPLSGLLYLVLHPVRVTAGPGWLAVRGLVRRRHVCTCLLTAVRYSEGVAARLVLSDSLGNRVELDPQILLDNPLLLHRLDTGARFALDAGLLRTGHTELRRLVERADNTVAKGVFEASDLY
ncbi:hypothetical protein [Streptomyces sp. KL118A]|uniref:hypothetical protein n=1 Tax=Streptomyces sp. KL118A TaxID=3045153 RepID=UPI00278BC8B8|nr:hypothetical protein [Streptomyces sp. KL118A]